MAWHLPDTIPGLPVCVSEEGVDQLADEPLLLLRQPIKLLDLRASGRGALARARLAVDAQEEMSRLTSKRRAISTHRGVGYLRSQIARWLATLSRNGLVRPRSLKRAGGGGLFR